MSEKDAQDPVEEPQPEVVDDAGREAAEDAWLEANIPADTDEEPEPAEESAPEPARKPDEAPDESEDTPAEAPAKERAEGKEQAETPDDVSAEDYESALTTVRRVAKPKKSLLDALSPREVVEWAAQLEGEVAERGRVSRELGELRKKLADTEASKEESGPGVPAQPSSLAELVQPVADALAMSGDDAKRLEKLMSGVVQSATSQVDKTLGEVPGVIEGMGKALAGLMFRFAGQQLQGQFPQLSDAAKFRQAREKAETLLATGDYKDKDDPVLDALADASRSEFFKELMDQQRASSTERKKQQLRGQPVTSSTTTPRTAESELTNEEFEDRILDAMIEGDKDEMYRLGKLKAQRHEDALF